MCFVRLEQANSMVWSLYERKAKVIISEQDLLLFFLTVINKNKHFRVRFFYRIYMKSLKFQI